MPEIILAATALYLWGSVPFSYLVARFCKPIDLREHGSGNVGATNVARVVGPLPGVLALLLDVGKGALSVYFLRQWGLPLWLSGLTAVGHNWSAFLDLSGGKGVAVSLGLLLMLDARAGLISLATWAALLLLTRYVALASMGALLSAPLSLYSFRATEETVVLMLALALMAVWQHRGNLARLFQGEEHRAF